ncbi:MAG: hypothetical protein M3Z24_14635 [Chloroflexota bacterium]|nr:hypothetical protein [Chloroflexota bacterium]
MYVKEHVKLSSAAALVALPFLKQEVIIPLTASILIDADHYLWHAIKYRTLSLRKAVRFFTQAEPQQEQASRIFHHPLILGTLLALTVRSHSRFLKLVLAGMLFHVSLDALHVTQLKRLKSKLTKQAQNICPACHQKYAELQLHTLHVTHNILDRYNSRHFMVLCPDCHVEAHKN